MLLGDLGADVIAVDEALAPERRGRRVSAEDQAGEVMREFALMTDFMRRNTRRIGLDLKQPDGQAVMRRLVAWADVLLEGFRPGVAARLGLDAETLRREHPRLIYCSISGYGQQGPYRDRAGHDVNYIALGGLLGTTGAGDGAPALPGTLVADLAAGGQAAAISILGALFGRERSGQGQFIDVSLQEGVVALMAPVLALAAAGQSIGPAGTLLTGAAPWYGVYQTADRRYVALGALEPWLYAELCRQLGCPHWIGRQFERAAWPAMRDEFARLFRGQPLAAWVERLAGTDACVTPVLTLEEVLADPQLAARATFTTSREADESEHLQVRALPIMSGTDHRPRRAPVSPGSDADDILEELGYEPEDRARL
jgi:crotonobetainyl-CoA:carnitine CoA-transferase CaiB-like acyl-CoA transferase